MFQFSIEVFLSNLLFSLDLVIIAFLKDLFIYGLLLEQRVFILTWAILFKVSGNIV